ncbi:hypothetical protein WJX73_004418 [Symbiochloris irregularis]|uniref:FAM192A/Fyv6 N-terminal domain-containing protein n=1 Tax=Symbiochloris irregularis TaxID=706552 RepID=A0AAW1NW32_9CHLO
MEDERPMEMIRVHEERLYDREAILGRDTASVFPSQSQQAAQASAESAKAALGASKFVSEKQLEELRAQRGDRVEDGAIAPDKPLVQVLAEAKEAKEEKFQAVWQSMKQGKNRPLDDDELEFVNEMIDRERQNDSRQAKEELQELEAYRQAVQAANLSRVEGIRVSCMFQ